MMTVGDLLDLMDGYDEEVEVRFATQPSYPLEYEIGGADSVMLDGNGTEILYLIEGNQLGYLPSKVTEAIGWRK